MIWRLSRMDFDDQPEFESTDFEDPQFQKSTTKDLPDPNLDIMFPPKDRQKAYKAFQLQVLQSFIDRLKVKKKIPLDEWVEREFKLPIGNAIPGKYSFGPAEFQREIFRTFSDKEHKDVVVCAASQTVKTQAVICLTAYHIANDPCPLLIGQPSQDLAHTFAKTKLKPQLMHNVGDKLLPKSTMQEIHYYGGECSIVTANSPQQLAMRSVRVAILDEADELDLSKQGSPLTVIRPRTSVYDDLGAKIIAISSPRDHGVIWNEYLEGDQRLYYIPCLECNQPFRLEWTLKGIEDPENVGTVHYTDKDPKTARINCPHCGSLFDNDQKNHMVRHGFWQKHNESRKASFRISSIYSSFVSLETLVSEWLDACYPFKNPGKLIPFFNTRLALLFANQQDEFIPKQKETNFGGDQAIVDSVPFKIDAIFAGCDQQSGANDGRLEITIVATNTDRSQYCVLTHEKIMGNIHYTPVWEKLSDYINDYEYQGHKISLAAIDSGPEGHPVLLLKKKNKLVRSIKGDATYNSLIDPKPRKNKAAGLTHHIGTFISKETVAALIQQECVTWLEGFTQNENLDAYWKQLNVEKRVEKTRAGNKIIIWEAPSHARNEAWDCLLYAHAIANLSKPKKKKKRKPQRTTPFRL